MNCCAEDYKYYEARDTYKSYDTPIFAGNFRFLLGLLIAVAGLYIGLLTEVKGHGLGFFLVFASPFIMLKTKTDEEDFKVNKNSPSKNFRT